MDILEQFLIFEREFFKDSRGIKIVSPAFIP